MKSKTWIWLLVVLLFGVGAGFYLGRRTCGIERVSGSEFLGYAGQTGMPQSVLDVHFLGTDGTRVYLRYWRGVRFLRAEYTVVWTPLSELPEDMARQLKEGKNPWARQ